MDYDVIVVGAGPAGSCAAKMLADAGAAVALVDAARFPRAKPCAGWLNARAAREFKFLDPVRRKIGAAPFTRLIFHSPDLAHTAEYGGRSHLGYIVSRRRFDAELVRLARAAGAETFLGRKATAVEAGECKVRVRLARGRCLTGRILIGADGVHSAVARGLSLRERWEQHQLVMCLSSDVPLTEKQMADCFAGGRAIHVALGFGLAPGYAWAFPGAGYVNVGVGVRSEEAPRLSALYKEWIAGLREHRLLPAKIGRKKPEGAAIPAGGALEFENHVGKRTLLIGDAGGFASASTGEGIYPGIRSATVAAECVLEALAADRGNRRGATCQDELLRFKHEWRRRMAPYLQMPNVNVAFLLPMIFTNREIAKRFARAFLFGENL